MAVKTAVASRISGCCFSDIGNFGDKNMEKIEKRIDKKITK